MGSLSYAQLVTHILDQGHTIEELCELLEIGAEDILYRFDDCVLSLADKFGDFPAITDGVYDDTDADIDAMVDDWYSSTDGE